jgi:hypothetical protein
VLAFGSQTGECGGKLAVLSLPAPAGDNIP